MGDTIKWRLPLLDMGGDIRWAEGGGGNEAAGAAADVATCCCC
jgi:hypothetical protein